MTMEVETEDRNGRVISLPQLQSLMRKDPEAYETEFDQQWSHFESMVDIFKMKPQKPHKSFAEQVMFLAHVVPSFPKKSTTFPAVLIGALNEHFQVMHPEMRQTLIAALILLRNRGQFPLMRTLPLYFKLFTLQDKGLRKNIFSHIIKDLVQMHMTSRNQKVSTELRDFFFGQLKDTDVEVARRACAVFISLYRQCCWRDAHTVNLVSAGLLHPDVKISAALAHLFLGNKTKGLEGILEDSDESEQEDNTLEIHGLLGSKKTANRKKRIERAKKAIKKAQTRRKKVHKNDSSVSFVAIDLLNDPQSLADRLLQRVSKGSEPYLFRLLVLHLIARLVGRHMLHLLNLYPYLIKYLAPSQREVTKFLACLVEASHSQVPPDELRPVVKHLISNFVSESQAPEVIEVGLNTIREVSSRAMSMLTEDELADLSGFRKHKNKGVAMAARSLINTYRELDPQLLHRSLRGREASMALSRGEVQERQFGVSDARDTIDGLELLAKDLQKKQKRRADDSEGEEEDEAKHPPAASATETEELDPKKMLTEQVLSADDFKRMRKVQLQKSIELQLGRKRKAEEISSSESESSSEEDSEDSDDERGLQGRLPDAMSADQLRGSKQKNRTKAARLASAQSGRVDFKEKLKERHAKRKGGMTNKEQRRKKPMQMVQQSAGAQRKKNITSRQKMSNLKKHIGTLQKKVGGKAKRRR